MKSTTGQFRLAEFPEYDAIPEAHPSGAHGRIASVVPLVVAKINYFMRIVTTREKAQFNRDDILQEIWVTLLEKDHYFDPNRGVKYATWSMRLVAQQLAKIRLRLGLITLPGNIKAQLSNPDKKGHPTIRAIRIAMSKPMSIGNGSSRTFDNRQLLAEIEDNADLADFWKQPC